MSKLSGNSGHIGSYTVERNGKKIPTSLEFNTDVGIYFYLHKFGQITITNKKGGFSKGFMKAHEVFTVSKIMSILYGEISPIAFKRLFDEAG